MHAHTSAVVTVSDLAAVGAPGPRWAGADPASLERVLFHLLQEYGRHLGVLGHRGGTRRRPDRGVTARPPQCGSHPDFSRTRIRSGLVDHRWGCGTIIVSPGDRPSDPPQWRLVDLNPNGQWGWIAAATDLPIAAAIADYLQGTP
jgi:hypothetical protein